MKTSKLNESKLSPAEVRRYLDYDEITGILTWRSRVDAAPGWNTRWTGKKAGYVDRRGYVNVAIHQITYLAHRLIWVHIYGEWPEDQIDHIDGNPSNNATSNLRKATASENQLNIRAKRQNDLGIKNVIRRRGTYGVSFFKCGIQVYCEQFKSLETAIAVRNLLAPNIYGEYDRRHP